MGQSGVIVRSLWIMKELVDRKYYEAVRPSSCGERLLVRARTRIYADFLGSCAPDSQAGIIDVGVSDVINDGANILEQLYPYPERITAAGLGEGGDFRTAFPRVTYMRIGAGGPLPFADQSFEIATANAVLEHVGGTSQQLSFVLEMARIARQVFITVPNRYFPVEHHTAIPLLHLWDPSFQLACRLLGKDKWARESELVLMSIGSLKRLAPSGMRVRVGYTGLAMGPLSSNLFLHLTRIAS